MAGSGRSRVRSGGRNRFVGGPVPLYRRAVWSSQTRPSLTLKVPVDMCCTDAILCQESLSKKGSQQLTTDLAQETPALVGFFELKFYKNN